VPGTSTLEELKLNSVLQSYFCGLEINFGARGVPGTSAKTKKIPLRIRTKICCIANVQEAQVAIRAGVDAIGLVANMPSGPGSISDRAIQEIAASVPHGVDTFLLSCKTEPTAVVEHVLRCKTSVVQLVDSVPKETYAALREACPNLRIVQVIHVENEQAITMAHELSNFVDAILLDSGKPGAAVPTLGGTGEVHNWNISAQIVKEISVPVYLAGGLNAGNVKDAIEKVKPYGLDLCSGVRTAEKLNSGLLHDYLQTVKEALRDNY
jgi:phosphoribosylanthranilate isomerase